MKIGLGLSGGGYRAAAFHIGVLKRLEELRILPRVELLSAVSGGAIIGAYYALRCITHGDGKPGSYPVDNLLIDFQRVLRKNLRGPALFGSADRAVRTLISFMLPMVRRSPLLVDAFDKEFYGRARLSELPSWILINATNLRTGKAWKFFNDRAGDYLVGATDDTRHISVAEAVGSSAAYLGLADPYPFRTRWEHLRSDLLADDRWQRPTGTGPYAFSRWRRRYGAPRGRVTFPLVDGGVYDNEGLIGLRGGGATHAILSNTAPAEKDFAGGWIVKTLARTVDVMHARLGAATRQLGHELTHAVHPNYARRVVSEVASELRCLSGAGAAEGSGPGFRGLEEIAQALDAVAGVGWPPRGHQFSAIAQILLHSTSIAENVSARYEEDPYDVPAEYRGLDAALVEEISRVRTDLDALEPEVFDLLVAQGYFLTDSYVKISMPDLIRECTGHESPRALWPSWEWAQRVIRDANSQPAFTEQVLRTAATSLPRLFGRSENFKSALVLWLNLLVAGALLTGSCWLMWRFLAWLLRGF